MQRYYRSTSWLMSAALVGCVIGMIGLAAPAYAQTATNGTTTGDSTAEHIRNGLNQGAQDCQYGVYAQQLSAMTYPAAGYADITNHTDCTYHVGVAVYKLYVAPRDWNDPQGSSPDKQWLYSQELYNYSEQDLGPRQTKRLQVAMPSCAWQIDTYQGSVIRQFTAGGEDYDDLGTTRAILSNVSQRPFSDGLPLCTHPTPQPTAIPAPTAVPTVQPTSTPQPTVALTHCPDGSMVTSGTTCPTPQVLGVSTTPTPPAKLPMTGPEVAMVLPLLGVVGGLLGRKYFTLH